MIKLGLKLGPEEYSPVDLLEYAVIADDQHFFSQNGLNVTINIYDAGLYAVDDLLDGEK
jgi:hypothetical protein